MNDPVVEQQFVAAFVKPSLRERWLEMLPSRKREKHLHRLSHHFDFEAPHIEKLPVRQGHRDALTAALSATNVPNDLYLISPRPELDGRWCKIREIDYCGYLEPYIAFCPPLQLALFRDEYHYYLMCRKRANPALKGTPLLRRVAP